MDKLALILSLVSTIFVQSQTTLISSFVKTDNLEIIRPKLEQKINKFQINQGMGLVIPVLGAQDFEKAYSYLVVNYDNGEVLLEKSSSKELPIASLTKIMTAVVALDLASADEFFTVSNYAAKIEPTKIGVVPNQKMSLEELLHALLLTSANDSAQVIAEGVDTKYQAPGLFIKAMNEKAKVLGLSGSNFTNPQGLDNPENYSSAKDLSLLSHYALENYPLIAQVVKKDYQFLPENQNHKQFDLYNWNGLLGVYPGVLGLKIGNTEAAGYTMVTVSEREGKKVMVIMLGAPGVLERDLWTAKLLDEGFSKLGLSPVGVTQNQLKAKYSTWKYWG